MPNEEYGDTNVILNGSERNRIFFQPNKDGIAYKYYDNLEAIYKVDANEGDKYKEWLLEYEIPKIKNDIENALVMEFINTGNEEEFWKHAQKIQDNFRKFNIAVKEKYKLLEFLRAYS